MKFVSHPSVATDRASLLELAITFLRLGATAFGGPAAHLAMMRSEFVDRRRWLTEGEFLDLIGASNLIPGPSSTEVAIFIGLRRAGWIGLILAGVFFILPAALIVTAIAWAYVRFGHLPQMGGVLYGVKPVIIAVVVQALWALGRTALKTRLISLAGVISLVLCFLGAPPLALLLGSGALLGVRGWLREPAPRPIKPLLALTALAVLLTALPLALTLIEPHGAQPIGLSPIFLVFAKVGSLVLGSGYVLLAFLRTDLILRLHWLTSAQLLDAVAVGQLTPGPVFTTATFIGYILAGPMGALVATLGIFLPAFLFVAIAGPLVPRIRRSPVAGSFLDGVNAAALALMAFVAWQLARAAFVDGLSVGISIAAAILLFRWRVNSAWLVLAGAVIGLLFHSY
ncbi:MAG: chromate efflux transporter [Capsulimonas sp.]|uniref:chromate efflux transporter n=1 Tax=Capsulimonas sp. TaxID=2494211 RepID=UPI003266C1FC